MVYVYCAGKKRNPVCDDCGGKITYSKLENRFFCKNCNEYKPFGKITYPDGTKSRI